MSTTPRDEQIDEASFIPGQWNIPYQYSTGKVASRFFRGLKDEARIYGTTCPSCKRTLIPPRGFCERCFVPCEEWKQVGPEGSVVAFTIGYRKFPGFDIPPPFMIALIRLDGADTNLIHFVDGCDLSAPERLLDRVRSGLRVEAVFRSEADRKGNIMDIRSFEALEG